jgi:hypothetical protein
MLAVMTLLETTGYAPINIAVGVAVFVLLVTLMAVLHGFGASRPHS